MPNPRLIADQLIQYFRSAGFSVTGPLDTEVSQGRACAIATVQAWQATARAHGDEFTMDDWIALVQELARRVAGLP